MSLIFEACVYELLPNLHVSTALVSFLPTASPAAKPLGHEHRIPASYVHGAALQDLAPERAVH